MIRISETRLIAAQPEVCFDLSRSVDFHKITGQRILAEAVAGRTTGHSVQGDWTVWSAVFFRMRFRIRMEVREFNRPSGWIDEGQSLLFRRFAHHYQFEDIGSPEAPLTRFTDNFEIACRGGIFAAPIEQLIILPRMQPLLTDRADKIALQAQSVRFQCRT